MIAAGRRKICRSWPGLRTVSKLIVAMAVAVVMATVGCSCGRDAGRIRVSGSVAFDGKPLGHGSVLFARIGDRGVASASIRSGGTFTAALLPGDYDVALRCLDIDGSAEPRPDWDIPKSLIPEKYTDAKTSGLKVTASAGMAPIRLDLAR